MGYVQQNDIHLHTSTVREALQFSALLRQPKSTSKAEKLAYVEEVLEIMEMKQYANAIVGVPGEGLNIEQRKRLTIAVEMASKPDLLLFLGEYRGVVSPNMVKNLAFGGSPCRSFTPLSPDRYL